MAQRVIDVKEGQFKTYEGDYQYFLESNEEAAAKEERFNAKEEEVRKDNIKAKSKMSKAEKMKLKKEKVNRINMTPEIEKLRTR
jgi:ATPase subunit of ABC transporter with duplicated ATPase domains